MITGKAIQAYSQHFNNKRKIRIENFRSLVMEEPIEIKPITLLFGKNGSGKSSFMKAIRFLGKNLFPLKAGATNYQIDDNTDLINFKECVGNNDISREIIIEYDELLEISSSEGWNKKFDYKLSSTFFDGKEGNDFKSLIHSDKSTDNPITIKLFPAQKNANIDKEFVENVALGKVSEMKEQFISVFGGSGNGYAGYPDNALFIKREFPKATENKWKKFFDYLDILPFANTFEDLRFTYYKSLANKLNFTKEDYEFLDDYIRKYLLIIPKLTEKFFVPFSIGPLREKPKSKYLLKGDKFQSSDYYGILNRIDEYYENYNPFYPGNKADESLDEYLSKQLSFFGLGKRILIKKKDGIGGIYVSDQDGTNYNLTESSSGLIQILPIIINEYFNEHDVPEYNFEQKGSRLNFLEQPELHLHPSLQTQLIEFLVKNLNTYIIETHSEHIVRKLQVLIAKGYPKERVAVYYFDKNNKTGITSIKEMELDEKGRFKEDWPDGFFDTDVQNTLDFFRELSKN